MNNLNIPEWCNGKDKIICCSEWFLYNHNLRACSGCDYNKRYV